MELLIMSLWDSVEHEPTKETYALRIIPSFRKELFRKPLKESSLYRVVFEYVFDDITPDYAESYSDHILFSPDLAEKILNDFNTNRTGCESLLVHCTQGLNRGPAVALALNEIFNLGYDNEVLKNKHPKFTKYIYDTLKKTATEFSF